MIPISEDLRQYARLVERVERLFRILNVRTKLRTDWREVQNERRSSKIN